MTRHFVPCLLVGFGVAGAALVTIAPFKVVADEGDTPCEAFCEAVFPDDSEGDSEGDSEDDFEGKQGENSKVCLKRARKAGPASFCGRCQADPARVCGSATYAVCCDPANSFCCPSADGPSCHAACMNGYVPDPASCGCVCPTGTGECGGSCVTCPSGRVPDPATCSCVCGPGTEECGGRCVPTGQCAPQACQQGTDPETGDAYVVCRADASTAWVSFSQPGGGMYHADQICKLLGYRVSGPFGGTCGNVCGFCQGATSCQAPGTEFYNLQGACGSDTHGPILCYTVHWECVQ